MCLNKRKNKTKKKSKKKIKIRRDSSGKGDKNIVTITLTQRQIISLCERVCELTCLRLTIVGIRPIT